MTVRNFSKIVFWVVAAISIVLSLPFVIGFILFAWEDFRFKTTKPDGYAILESVFPYSLTRGEYLHINAERVKFIKDDAAIGSGHTQEGGACAIVGISKNEDITALKMEISNKFALLDYNSPSSISLAQSYNSPSDAVCNFLPKSGWKRGDYQVLTSSSTCDKDCTDAAEFQEYTAFYNSKLNQVLIEVLDYDGDHANSFP